MYGLRRGPWSPIGLIALWALVSAQSAVSQTQHSDSLALNSPRTAALEPGAAARWIVTVPEGHFVVVLIRQVELDVQVSLYDPTGLRRIDGIDVSEIGGREHVEWLAEVAGSWSVEVQGYGSSGGTYEIEWVDVREPTERDLQVVQADSLEDEFRELGREGEHERALVALRKAAEIREASGPPTVYWDLLRRAGRESYNNGRFDDAVHFYKRASAALENSPWQPWSFGGSLNGLAIALKKMARYREAEAVYQKLLALDAATTGTDGLNYATTLGNLASLDLEVGQYEEARSRFERQLRIESAILGSEHTTVATTYNELGVLSERLGWYAEAESFHRRALAIRDVLDPDVKLLASSFSNLGFVLYRRGEIREAEEMFRRALDVWESSQLVGHPDQTGPLTNLGHLLTSEGRYDEAEVLLQQALAIDVEAYSENHPEVAADLTVLAGIALGRGDFSSAEQMNRRSLEIASDRLGPDHPEVGRRFIELARVSYARKDYHSGLARVDSALAVLLLSPGHPEWTFDARILRGRLLDALGDRESAASELEQALLLIEELRPQVGGGEETRATFFSRYAEEYDRMVSWRVDAGDLASAFEFAERGRARSLLDLLALNRVDLSQSIPLDRREQLRTRETVARARMAEFQQRVNLLRGRADLTDEDRTRRITALEDSLQTAADEFGQVYDEIKNASTLWSYVRPEALQVIQRDLVGQNNVLLLYQIGADGSYVFLIPPPGEPVQAVPLTVEVSRARAIGVEPGPLTSRTLQAALASAMEPRTVRDGEDSPTMARGLEADEEGARAQVLHALFQILLPDVVWERIRDTGEAVVIPHGALHTLPFEALVLALNSDEGVRYWLDEGPPIRYGPSATVLYNIAHGPASRRFSGPADLLSLSDPIYDPREVALAMGGTGDSGAGEPADADLLLSAVSDLTRSDYERAGGTLARLPGTALETEAIVAAFGADRTMGDVTVLQREYAREPLLRAGFEGRRYLHLATHGLVDNRRGSLFAGLAVTPPPDETSDGLDDGFLQLHEIYDLKLPDVELAVLSACDTNVGEEIEGEGVFALSRGFLAAGARRVIASQWSVNDASTAALMRVFFTAIAEAERRGERVDYSLALRDAKRELRSRPEWSDPYYWAPFLLIGQR